MKERIKWPPAAKEIIGKTLIFGLPPLFALMQTINHQRGVVCCWASLIPIEIFIVSYFKEGKK